MQGLISMLEIPSAVGPNSGMLSVRAQFGTDAVPLPSEAVAGAFHQQFAGILIPMSTDAPTIEPATDQSAEPSDSPGGVFPNQEPVDAPGLDQATTGGFVALLLSEITALNPHYGGIDFTEAAALEHPFAGEPNLDVVHLASSLVDFYNLPNSSAGAQVDDANPGVRHLTTRGTGFVDSSEQSSVSRSTVPLRPLQSVVLFGPGDFARASATSDGPNSVPPPAEPLPVGEGEVRRVFSWVQVIAETLPGARKGIGFESAPGQPTGVKPRLLGAPAPTLGRDEVVQEPAVDTAVRSSNPHFASDPESSQVVSIGPSISRPIATRNRTAENRLSIGGNLSNAEDQQPSHVASSDSVAPSLPRAQPGDGQVLNQQAAEAGSEQKPLVADAENSQSSRATSDQRSDEGVVTKNFPSGNGPTGPFLKVPEDHKVE